MMEPASAAEDGGDGLRLGVIFLGTDGWKAEF